VTEAVTVPDTGSGVARICVSVRPAAGKLLTATVPDTGCVAGRFETATVPLTAADTLPETVADTLPDTGTGVALS
jgi:hypothetical protein